MRGFTLVELVMVLVLTGVLAVYVGPKLLSSTDFSARGFHDETLSMLRYAHKSAIAQRRSVCVTFTASSATLTLDADQNSATGGNGCEANLTGPRGETPGRITAGGSVQYATTPTTVVFDGLGQPGAGQTLQVQGAAGQIVIEPVTGHVHE
jgi:MSHA pilin protein MshC